MAEVTTYSFQEGLLDTVLGAMRPIEVVDDRGTVAGRIVRGELDGCERSGTFRYEPAGGAPTEVGVRRMTARTVLGRLLRPTYVVTHGEERWELKDLPGENILYFALAGEVAGLRLDAREDWDGSIEVVAREPGDRSKRGARRVCRFNSGDLLVRTAVRAGPARHRAVRGPGAAALPAPGLPPGVLADRRAVLRLSPTGPATLSPQ